MNIDWSKAPEDATHAGTTTGHQIPVFYKDIREDKYSYLYDDGGGWREDAIGHPSSTPLIERPKKQDAWDGNGKPPIGIECEVRINDAWRICKTLAYHQVSDTAVAVHFLDGSNSLFWCGTFRPIKTAEQLAEEEKKQAIDEMQRIYEESMLDYSSRLGHASRPAIKDLYEAGYRKQ